MVGELYRSYILVEQGDEAFLIDKHAAHERILFEKLRANPTDIILPTLLATVFSTVLGVSCTALGYRRKAAKRKGTRHAALFAEKNSKSRGACTR